MGAWIFVLATFTIKSFDFHSYIVNTQIQVFSLMCTGFEVLGWKKRNIFRLEVLIHSLKQKFGREPGLV